ncbi:MAG: LVIVD repeat-containing protein [Candidatus Heimdallarchaeota archaeon]
MSTLKRVRNISILVVIIFSIGFYFEQAKMISSVYSDVDSNNDIDLQTQAEPINEGNLEAASVVNVTEHSSWDENYGIGIKTITQFQYSFILTATEGIHVIDKTQPANPFYVSSWTNLSINHNYIDFVLRGDFLYILDSFGQVTIVDIVDVSNFGIVSTIMVGISSKLKMHEDLLFIFESNYLKIYDISSPGAMVFVDQYLFGTFFASYLYDFDIINQTAYFIGEYGLQIYNITDLNNITRIGSMTAILDSSNNYKISVKDNLTFIGTLDYGIVIYNTTNLTNPTYLYNILNETSSYHYSDWFFINDYLLVFNKYKELILCNATDLYAMHYIETTELASPISIEKYQDTLIISESKYLSILDISDIRSITLLGRFDMGGYGIGVTAYGNFVYLANGGSGLEIISMANPEEPITVANVFLDSHADGLCLANDLAFVACFLDGVFIIDISNPLEPIVLSQYVSPSEHQYYYDLAIKDNILYIANGYAGVEIVDISIASSPVLINSFNLGFGFAQAIDTQNDLAFVVDGIIEVAIFDISSPVYPTIVRSITPYLWGPREVVAEGDYLYILDYFSGFSIIDIDKPHDPKTVSRYNTGEVYFRHLTVWGEYVYLTNSFEGMYVVDCYDKEKPGLIQRYDNDDPFFEIYAYKNYVYLANGYNGLLVFGAKKTRLNDFDLPIMVFILSVTLIASYVYKKRKRKLI